MTQVSAGPHAWCRVATLAWERFQATYCRGPTPGLSSGMRTAPPTAAVSRTRKHRIFVAVAAAAAGSDGAISRASSRAMSAGESMGRKI